MTRDYFQCSKGYNQDARHTLLVLYRRIPFSVGLGTCAHTSLERYANTA